MSDAAPPWAYEQPAVHPYDPRWAETAAGERARLAGLLAPWLAGGVEHVGSTAVPGLAAKPVIDLMASVRDADAAVREAGELLAADGWCYVPPDLDGRPWRRFFVKPDASGQHRAAHLHVMTSGEARWARQLAFCDALRRDDRLARRYEALKRRLAVSHADDREAYTDAKAQFIADALEVPMADGNLSIPFSLRGISGLIAVSVTPNTDPDAVGYSLLSGGQPTDAARGFPVCRATVTYPADGYAAVFGWTQLVRSTDSDPDQFEMDPIALYQQVPTPYAFFGVRPELFDAPSREARYDMAWEAHSFLCVSPDAVLTRRVQAVAGFRWGFTINHGDITLAPPTALGPQAWDSHLDLFRTSYPTWNFDSGYVSS